MRIPEGLIPPITTGVGIVIKELSDEQKKSVNIESDNDEQNFQFFAKRIIDWPFDDECSIENKRRLWERSRAFCMAQVIEANNLIAKKKCEEIENLLNGANGTTHPED